MYLLDTDVCLCLMQRRYPALLRRVRTFAPRVLKVSVVSVYELEYGARRSHRREQASAVLLRFLANVEVLPFDAEAARQASVIRAVLAASGTSLGAYDLLIAGHARATGATLVANKVCDFSRVAGLAVESWAT